MKDLLKAEEKSDLDGIIKVIRSAGYEVAVGADGVKRLARDKCGTKERLCSGYGVFPGGDKCSGCSDCGAVDGGL